MPTDLSTDVESAVQGEGPGKRLWLVPVASLSVVGLWLLFITVFSDVYGNSANSALLVAALLVACGVLAFRFPRQAMAGAPVVFVVGMLVSSLPVIIDGSPRSLLASQALLAVCLGAGLSAWRRASARARRWALALLCLGAIVGLQAQIHTSTSLSSTWQGIPLALGCAAAAATALAAPSAVRLATGYLAGALVLWPFVVVGVVRDGRAAVEIGTFAVNFLSVVLGMGLIAAVMVFVRTRSRWVLAAAIVLIPALVMVNSKTVLLALFFAACSAVLMNRHNLSATARIALVTASAVAAAAAFVLPALLLSRAASTQPVLPGTRTVGDAAISVKLRVDLTAVSAPNIAVSPLIGVGYFRNTVYYTETPKGDYVLSRSPFEGYTGTYAPHNSFVSMPVSLGVPVALALGAVWFGAVLVKRDPHVRSVLVPMVVFTLGTALTIDWERSHLAAVFWLPVGLLLAAPDEDRHG